MLNTEYGQQLETKLKKDNFFIMRLINRHRKLNAAK